MIALVMTMIIWAWVVKKSFGSNKYTSSSKPSDIQFTFFFSFEEIRNIN